MQDFQKIQSIMEIQRLGLPTPETIFVLDCEKQDNEIESFLADKDFVMIRSDKKGASFCPNNLKCPKHTAKEFIRELNKDGYAAILQEHVPWHDTQISGNILLLKNHIIIEVMQGGPLTRMNRYGEMHEHIKIERFNDCKEVYRFGKRVLPEEIMQKIVKMVENLPFSYRIVEFAVAPNWLYFWQIRDDESSKMLEQ